jgi:hypothetical protein
MSMQQSYVLIISIVFQYHHEELLMLLLNLFDVYHQEFVLVNYFLFIQIIISSNEFIYSFKIIVELNGPHGID